MVELLSRTLFKFKGGFIQYGIKTYSKMNRWNNLTISGEQLHNFRRQIPKAFNTSTAPKGFSAASNPQHGLSFLGLPLRLLNGREDSAPLFQPLRSTPL